ncbi:MAG: DUF885 family protein [Candidatus Aminicenantes bacterium]|nr:DUF885 family protein [Candidatus Aminicenantes bacterium]
MKQNLIAIFSILTLAFFTIGCRPSKENTEETIVGQGYEELLNLFNEFREFQKPRMTAGVPDYSAAAMEKQRQGLVQFQNRLAAFDIAEWPIPQQVDFHIVRAEMNGLEFYHRVLRPWSRDPCFYLQSQAGAGPVVYGALRIPHHLPMSPERLEEFAIQLRSLPSIFEQAKVNLTEGARDLTTIAIWGAREESDEYGALSEWLREYHPDMVEVAERAQAAAVAYGQWLEENKGRMTAPSGVGKENYTWWLKNVHLFPYTWEDCRNDVKLEDNRVRTFLKLEEHKNRALPPLLPVDTKEEHQRRKREALEYVMKFLNDNKIVEIPDYLDSLGYLEPGGIPREEPWPRERDFFEQTGDREPLPEMTHEFIGHYFDHLRHNRDERPIRGARRLYEIDWIRSEGFAFALEELLMYAGYLDSRPQRGREIVYLQAAFRRCRAMADLKLHSGEFGLEDAMQYCVDCAPNGWLLDNGPHVRYEMQTTLRFVGWHMGMVMGKVQFIKLLTDRAEQLGDRFDLGKFMEEFLAAGMIPMSLIRWEMTGLDDEIKLLLEK